MPAGEQPSGKRELLVSTHLAPGRRAWSSSSASSSSSCSPIAPTSPIRRSPTASVDPSGQRRLHRRRHPRGQKVFLHHGLMEYGSIFGHGAYLGPDFTADYLHRSSAIGPRPARRQRLRLRAAGDDRPVPDQPLRPGHQDARRSRAQQAQASAQLNSHYADFFDSPTTRYGLRPEADQRSAADPRS